MSMTPAQRSLRARMGAYAMHAKHDPRETTAAAREGLLRRFERELDPEGQLAPDERRRRAIAARAAHMQRIALRSSQARRGRAA